MQATEAPRRSRDSKDQLTVNHPSKATDVYFHLQRLQINTLYSNKTFKMCSADIFLGLIAILFPPLAGKIPLPFKAPPCVLYGSNTELWEMVQCLWRLADRYGRALGAYLVPNTEYSLPELQSSKHTNPSILR